MKLLIVDDNPNIRVLIKHLLSPVFDDVFEGKNGLEAFAAYKEYLPDWVVMDIEMPEVDGLVGAKMIKNQFANAKIVFVSKFQDEEMINLTKYIGGAAYFSKDNLLDLESFFDRANLTGIS